jgi:hypothetical protein
MPHVSPWLGHVLTQHIEGTRPRSALVQRLSRQSDLTPQRDFSVLDNEADTSFPQHWPDWLNEQIWPQIQTMMLNDAYFRLMGRAREITGQFNGPIASLIEMGYLTSQTVAIRRLCDQKKDVISLRRLLIEAADYGPLIGQLATHLDDCDHVVDLVNNHVAHTANPHRRPNATQWNLQVEQLIKAQRAICEVAVRFDRDVMQQRNYVKIIPVPQIDIMQEFRPWVPEDGIQKLWEFWHTHNEVVNAWRSTSS